MLTMMSQEDAVKIGNAMPIIDELRSFGIATPYLFLLWWGIGVLCMCSIGARLYRASELQPVMMLCVAAGLLSSLVFLAVVEWNNNLLSWRRWAIFAGIAATYYLVGGLSFLRARRQR